LDTYQSSRRQAVAQVLPGEEFATGRPHLVFGGNTMTYIRRRFLHVSSAALALSAISRICYAQPSQGGTEAHPALKWGIVPNAAKAHRYPAWLLSFTALVINAVVLFGAVDSASC
jgi:hypothetical protein